MERVRKRELHSDREGDGSSRHTPLGMGLQ